LDVVRSPIADPDWFGVFMTGEVIQGLLFEILAAVNGVHARGVSTALGLLCTTHIWSDPSEFCYVSESQTR
jgi:hypothetical protein